MRTAVYVRVSTEEQAKEGYSTRAQIDKLKDYIKIKDWEFYKVYADEGISGKNITDRPAINELIEDIKQGLVENVVVYKIDRLTRNTRDLIDLTEIFKSHHCDFNSLMESIDTGTASGRMFLKIIGIFAEFERENTIERVMLACEKKVKEGYTLNSCVTSYGYDRKKGDLIQKINTEEAKIVKEIFDMYVCGSMSYSAIVKNLNHRDIKPKIGETWHPNSVRRILKNPNYIGKVRYSICDEKRYFEAAGKHEPIVSENLFYQAESRMRKIKRKSYTKRPNDDNYFCGTIYCGKCGAKLTTHIIYKTLSNGEKIAYGQYRCYNVSRGLCNSSTFSHIKTEKAFQEYISTVDDITAISNIPAQNNSNREDLKILLHEEYEKAISKIEKKEKSVMMLYLNERINFDEYSQMTKILSAEKEKYIKQTNIISENQGEEIILTNVEKETNLKENWVFLTNSEKMIFMQDYIEKIMAVSLKNESNSCYNTVKILEIKFCSDVQQ